MYNFDKLVIFDTGMHLKISYAANAGQQRIDICLCNQFNKNDFVKKALVFF